MSCNSEKIIELPEIKQATITEINDVSPAYLFYDETQPDRVELNRKNLISTTNWLVNVDKRLTLGQAIPKIQFLQQKKNNSSHKNEAAKNYYTCHDLSENNLGFIEFTNVVYHLKMINSNSFELINKNQSVLLIDYNKDRSLTMVDILDNKLINRGVFKLDHLEYKNYDTIILSFSKDLSFQDYISLKDKLTSINFEDITIDNNEFIY